MGTIRHVTDIAGFPPPKSPYSLAVVAGGFVFVSGQVGVPPDGGALPPTIGGQVRQALENLRVILQASGSSMENIAKVTVLMARTEPEAFAQMNEAYAAFFPGPKPARSVARLGVDLPGVYVSIDAIAEVA